ncbi:MAG TPA: helix-turn-helix transcriptional regulator [Pseudonocardiaceae bacterium]|jgi:transcriptional regulator with XRE-family HTH domain|nr:helix-turn-helix transcriptional regulator [Pseudonocardiaceae bacterium]
MTTHFNASIRSRRVSAELRRYREEFGMTSAQAAEALGCSASKLSRIETGSRGLHVEDVAALLGLYRVPERRRDELLELVRKADERGLWFAQGSGLPELWKTLIDFERLATRIQNFESLFVPGLLQTADYCAAIIQAMNEAITGAELDKLVSARMSRQMILRRQDLQLLAVIDEVVLRRVIGDPATHRRQLRRLVDESERDNITLRVVPLVRGAYPGLRGPFMTMDFADEPSVVYVENQTLSLFLEEKDDLAAFRLSLGNILSKALGPAESADFIATVAEQT